MERQSPARWARRLCRSWRSPTLPEVGSVGLHQPALVYRSPDERGEQRMRLKRPRFELGVELHADEPGMVLVLDHLRQQPVRRHAGKPHPVLLEATAIPGIDLVAMTVALGNLGGAIVDLARTAAALQQRWIGPEPHRTAKLAVDAAPLELVALHPLGHQADHRFRRGAELGRVCLFDAAEIARRLDHGHLHPEANPEIRDLARARELRGLDLPFGTALSKSAVDENSVHVLREWRRILALQHLGPDPGEIRAHPVGD